MKRKQKEESDEEPTEFKVSKVAIDQDFLTKRDKNRVKRRKKETRKALQRMKLLSELEAVPQDLLDQLKQEQKKNQKEESEEQDRKQTEKEEEELPKKPIRLVDKQGHRFQLTKKRTDSTHFQPRARTMEKQKAFKEALFNSVQRVKFRNLY